MLSITHLIVLLVIVLIVFGAGRLPHVMGDLGKGIRNFKAGLNGETPPDAKDKEENKPQLTARDENEGKDEDKNGKA